MDDSQPAAEAFLSRVIEWASARPDVKAVLVIGSRARTVAPADALSDIDLMLVTTRPRFYASTTQWLHELGDLVLTCTFSTVVGTRAVRTGVFRDGNVLLQLDAAMVGSFESRIAAVVLRLLARFPGAMRLVPYALRQEIESWFDALRKGAPRVLLDKDGSAGRMFGFVPPPPVCRAPSRAEFEEVVHSFLSLSLWNSNLLLRGEPWRAAHVCATQMRDRLVRVLEWHARATRGPDHDVWYGGRFFERWADPRAAAALRDVFGRYDTEDAWRALLASVELFSWIARETAEKLGLPYPSAAEAQASSWLAGRFASRGGRAAAGGAYGRVGVERVETKPRGS